VSANGFESSGFVSALASEDALMFRLRRLIAINFLVGAGVLFVVLAAAEVYLRVRLDPKYALFATERAAGVELPETQMEDERSRRSGLRCRLSVSDDKDREGRRTTAQGRR
jgi:hypothetical protein